MLKDTQITKMAKNYLNLPNITKRPKMVNNNAKNGPICVLTITFCPNKIP